MNAATKLIAKLNVAKKQLGLDEDTYRAALETATGKRSVKEMSEAERLRALAHFEARGFQGLTRRPALRDAAGAAPQGEGRRLLTGKYAGKLQALWIAGWNLGLVRSRDDMALLAFIKRQTGIDHSRFLRDGEDAAKVIEALKGWLARAGVDWNVGDHIPAHARLSGFKIAMAQNKILQRAGAETEPFQVFVLKIAGRWPSHLTREADWIPVMNAFGERVRAMKTVDVRPPLSAALTSPPQVGRFAAAREARSESPHPVGGPKDDRAAVGEGESA
jgi:Protein of unknown function (DUF1018)